MLPSTYAFELSTYHTIFCLNEFSILKVFLGSTLYICNQKATHICNIRLSKSQYLSLMRKPKAEKE